MPSARQFDLFGAKSARDEAMDQVDRNAGRFLVDALLVTARLPRGAIVIGEDIRRTVRRAGFNPHHHNAWGVLIKRTIERGFIVPTGRYEPMHDTKSYARKTPVCRRC
jgi:hypothetical protein